MPTFDLPTVRQRLSHRTSPFVEGDAEAKAAVATILRDGPRGAEALFIKRAEREGDPWSGHIAFPGGKREPGDATLLDTARRETQEEVALALPEDAFVTRLADIGAHTNGLRVAHFVFALAPADAQPAANVEVAALLWVSLESIAQGEGAGTFTFTRGDQSFDLPSLTWGSYVLWGMTYRMAMNLIAALEDPSTEPGP